MDTEMSMATYDVEYVTKQTVIDELSRYGMTEDGEAIINAIPAADVVEVVRCGECIRKYICRTSNVWAVSPDDNWFCADGKRKDGGHDELCVISEVGDGTYKKDFIYLNEWTTYVCTDLTGAKVDRFHYELNILPQMVGGVTFTIND